MANATDTARPSVFIGSSSEGLDFARGVRASLDGDAEVTLWKDGIFELGLTSVENLVAKLRTFDFAVLVLTPDDKVQSRSADMSSPRDNVIFELGLFMGSLGRGRTFILQQMDASLKVPSDLAGVTVATYQWPRNDVDHQAAVGAACDEIRKQIKKVGCRGRVRAEDSAEALQEAQVTENGGDLSADVDGCEVRVVFGRLEEYATEDRTAVVLPCNEYFDDRCAYDVKSALGAYVHNRLEGRVAEFIAASQVECRKRLGEGMELQKTADERAVSYGSGRCVLLERVLESEHTVALISTTTQRAGQGLCARTSYIFDGIHELVMRLVDIRLRKIVMPILGSGNGRIHPVHALTGMLLALRESIRSSTGGSPLLKATIVVFRADSQSKPAVHPSDARNALALISTRDGI